jgi:hypothetical protein
LLNDEVPGAWQKSGLRGEVGCRDVVAEANAPL